MLLPMLLLVLVYSYIPMLGNIIAFQKFVPSLGVLNSKWIGLDNFRYVFNLPSTAQVIYNTIIIASMKIVASLIIPTIIALLLNEINRKLFWVKKSVQTLIYLPHFISWVLLSGIIIDILSPRTGIINKVITLFGFEPIYFLTSNSWFRFVMVSTDVWKEFGFSTIIFLAAITSIDPTLYEAASIDGAKRLRQTWHITLPGMKPIILLMAILSLGNILNAGFDQIFNLYNPLVYETGDILDTLIYRTGIVNAQYGVATAIGIFKSMVGCFLISISYWFAYKFSDYRIF